MDADYYFSCEMPATVVKKGSLTIALDTLSAILKSRAAELEFTVKENKLNFKSSSARVQGKDIPLLGVEEDKEIHKPKSALLLPKKLQRRILMLMDTCALPSFYGKILAQTIFSEKDKIHVVCADQACAAIATMTTKEKVNIPKTDVPSEYSEKLKHIPGDDFALSFSRDMMIVSTSMCHVQLKMLQTDKLGSVAEIMSFEDSKVTSTFKVDGTKIKAELDAITISYEKQSPIECTLKDNTMHLLYKTSNGRFSSTLAVQELSKACSFNLDLEILRNLLNRTAGKLMIKVRDSSVAICFTMDKGISVRFIILKLSSDNHKDERKSSK